jgi:hypothetical protein
MFDYKAPACPGCASEGCKHCLYDCATRSDAAMAALRTEHPDMTDDALFRLDAHQWIEANFTYEEQCDYDFFQ